VRTPPSPGKGQRDPRFLTESATVLVKRRRSNLGGWSCTERSMGRGRWLAGTAVLLSVGAARGLAMPPPMCAPGERTPGPSCPQTPSGGLTCGGLSTWSCWSCNQSTLWPGGRTFAKSPAIVYGTAWKKGKTEESPFPRRWGCSHLRFLSLRFRV